MRPCSVETFYCDQKLRKLAQLQADGLISAEEFEKKRAEIIQGQG